MTEAAPPEVDAPTSHRRPNFRRRRWVVGILAFLLVLLLAAIGLYWHLNSNIRSTDITRGGATNGDLTKAQPLNFLVLGSDTRSSSEDCKIGGGCSSASATASNGSAATGNADVEMLVHLSADRTHAQTVSIPRDTVVDIPECTDPSTGQTVAAHRARINSSMNYGPECTVATVHQLTGLPIAHLAVIDFAGVVTMSNAIGGVNVCVDNDVYDPYSHLKLKKGSHTLQGQAALQFLRTRHAFGDGSDLGRTGAQHLFLSAMQRKMTSASTLVNPVTAYKLADAATKAVTVDKGLDSVTQLVEAAYQFGKVPNSGSQMLTMPTIPNPANTAEVLPAGSAQQVWDALAADRPVGSSSGSSSSGSSSPGSGSAGSASSSSAASSSPSDSSSAASASGPSPSPVNAQENTGCAQVSTLNSVTVNGVLMTPTEAYAATPQIADSAP